MSAVLAAEGRKLIADRVDRRDVCGARSNRLSHVKTLASNGAVAGDYLSPRPGRVGHSAVNTRQQPPARAPRRTGLDSSAACGILPGKRL